MAAAAAGGCRRGGECRGVRRRGGGGRRGGRARPARARKVRLLIHIGSVRAWRRRAEASPIRLGTHLGLRRSWRLRRRPVRLWRPASPAAPASSPLSVSLVGGVGCVGRPAATADSSARAHARRRHQPGAEDEQACEQQRAGGAGTDRNRECGSGGCGHRRRRRRRQRRRQRRFRRRLRRQGRWLRARRWLRRRRWLGRSIGKGRAVEIQGSLAAFTQALPRLLRQCPAVDSSLHKCCRLLVINGLNPDLNGVIAVAKLTCDAA